MKSYYCENCAFFDELKNEQPCCCCVDGINFVKLEEEEQTMSKEQIEEMTHEEVYHRYKEKKRQCKTIAQEVELVSSDPEMIMLIERLKRDNNVGAKTN